MDNRIISKVEKIIRGYIPHHPTCAIEECKRAYLRQKEKNIILSGIKEKVEKISNPLQVSITEHWEKQDPDMSVCNACKNTIYGSQYMLFIQVCGENVEQSRPVKLCEPCYLSKKS